MSVVLYGVRWKDEKNGSYLRTEFPTPEAAIAEARKLKSEGKFHVNIKLVDAFNGEFIGNLKF